MVKLDKVKLGKEIKKWRLNKGYTLSDLGCMFEKEIDKGTVSHWEEGDYLPRIKRIPELVKIMGVTVDELIERCRKETDEEIIENIKVDFYKLKDRGYSLIDILEHMNNRGRE